MVITITAMRQRAALTSLLALTALAVGWPISAGAAFGGGRDGASSHVAGAPRLPIVPRGSWPVYHHDDAHSGNDPTQLPVNSVKQGWTSATLDEQVYASPLVYGGIVYAATLNNTVYALNQIDGSPVWSMNLGTPETRSVPGDPIGWFCGNVSPQGILGTPVVDPTTGRIYAAALIKDPVVGGSKDLYKVSGLNLVTGHVDFTTTIPANIGSGFDWTIQQQRGALAVRNGYVYVPFGGRAGDCGNPNTGLPYYGWVVGVPTNGSTSLVTYQTPGGGSGFWAAGGVVVDDSTGKVFVTSGNGIANGCNANLDGTPMFENDAVVRLSSTLAHEGSFVPVDWQNNWCNNDQDLGSAPPVLISPSLMFQSGKWGTGFLLNPANLGGMDGQLFPTPNASTETADVCFGNHSDATFGSFAYAAPFVYVECEGQGLVALKVDIATHSFAICGSTCSAPDWHAGSGLTFGPPIVAAGAVWVADFRGSGLYAFRADTGALLYQSSGFGVNRFVTLAEAGGEVFVPAGNQIMEFVVGFGTAQSSPPPPPSARGNPVAPASPPPAPSRPPVSQSSPPPTPFGR